MTIRRATFVALAVLAGGLVATGVAASRLRARSESPYRGYAGAEVFVDVAPGSPASAIARQLVAVGVVRDAWAFRYALWQTDRGRQLQAGEYRFDRPLSARQVVEKLAAGDIHLRPITFPEGLTIWAMAEIFGTSGFGTADEFLDASRKADRIASLDPDATDLEGYLFPDTYALPRTATAADLVEAMVARFEQAFDEPLRRDVVDAGRTVREIVTLASLIERETALAEERAVVSAVYTNRLRIDMALQCDPSVIYALERAGLYEGNLTRDNLRYDSPYNTYVYPGLPPGPIAAPGRSALEAAVRPADAGYLYFVSRNDGSHVFASSLREHNRNVREYQIRYFREQRRRREQATPPGD